MSEFLITGANGQLAQQFARRFEREGTSFKAFSREALDVTNEDGVHECIGEVRPSVILNCAAYNNVNRADHEREQAVLVNADSVAYLARAANAVGALLVHYGSDFVFDGRKEGFYDEDDATNPLNTYGASKLAGEARLKEESDNYLLLRVSWVMGLGQNCFLSLLERLVATQTVIRMTTDYLSIPTYTGDIVDFTLLALSAQLRGTYHLTSNGYASKYEQAKYYLDKKNCSKLVLPVTSDYFDDGVERPYFCAMSNRKLCQALNREMPHWQQGIDRLILDHEVH